MLRGCNQTWQVVADDALEDYFHAELVQLLGEVERIGVAAEGREQFRADRDNLGFPA
jgi:hypothetical protein